MVRTIAMGLPTVCVAALAVANSGAPVSVPVGKATLGRIMDVLGDPIDERARSAKKAHADPPQQAPAFDELSAATELLETGIKVIDLIARSPRAVKWVCSAAPAWARL